MLSRLAGVSEAGARWRNPERSLRGIQEAEAKLKTRKRFVFSLIAFAVLAILSWHTMSSDPIVIHERSFGVDVSIRFRTVTLVIIGLLAARTTLAFFRSTAEERREAGFKE